MPSPQKIKYILDKSIISRLKSTNSNPGESFLDFCCYLTHFIESQCDGEVVGVMAIREGPITAKYSRIQKEKLKSEFNSTMMLVNLRKNKGLQKDKKKKTNNTSSEKLLANASTTSTTTTTTNSNTSTANDNKSSANTSSNPTPNSMK